MTDSATEQLQHLVERSELLAERRAEEAEFDSLPKRALKSEEIARLEAQGNSSSDWAAVTVTDGFRTERIIGSRFEGRVELGRMDSDSSPFHSSGVGIFHSTIVDSKICESVRISHCDKISRAFVSAEAVIESVAFLGMVATSSHFGNGLVLFEEELYSRRLQAYMELPFSMASLATGPSWSVLWKPEEAAEQRQVLEDATEKYLRTIESETAFIGRGAKIRATPLVENCWVGGGVSVDAAGTLRDSTFWGGDERVTVRDGAHTDHALIGPGCTLADNCSVTNSMLTEQVQVGTQAIVKGSFIGPNVRLAEAEINDSLVGPFTTAIHQALLIAAWWPWGKGNVGYGANVGSNHTGRAPDQEIWPGEGMFFGLGCNIKFPSNFREAQYSIIATGVTTLPQKVGFPFSLIASPSVRVDELSPAINEIRPGWALLDNAYGIERQEQNFAKRNKARRNEVDTAVLNPGFFLSLQRHRAVLSEVGSPAKALYTSEDLEGLGKNFMTEAARLKAIEAYDLGIRIAAGRYLVRTLRAGLESNGVAWLRDFLPRSGDYLGASTARDLLETGLAAEQSWLDQVIASRKKDEKRGSAILYDYAKRHVGIDEDPVIVAARANLEEHRANFDRYLELLEPHFAGGPASGQGPS